MTKRGQALLSGLRSFPRLPVFMKLQITIPNNFTNRLNKLGRELDEILDEAIADGAEKAYDIIRPSLAKSIGSNPSGKSESTGELLHSLGVTPVKVDQNGYRNAKIGFNEPRKHQPKTHKGSYKTQTNAMIATVLEYGRRDKSQPARPFLRPVKKKAEEAFAKAVEEDFDKKVNQL